MNKQISLSILNDELLQVRTKKKEFLEQIEHIVPWGECLALIKPCYYKGECGNKPYDLELMLSIYLRHHRTTLSKLWSNYGNVKNGADLPNFVRRAH